MTTNNQTELPMQTSSAKPAVGRSPWRRWWWLGGLVLVVGMPFVFSSSSDAEGEELRSRRETIQNMSLAERGRLEDNYAKFETLSEEEQAHLRSLAASISNTNRLKTALAEFDQWLNTLSPWQRREFQEAENADEKIAIVKTIQAERTREQLAQRKWMDDWQKMRQRFGYIGSFQRHLGSMIDVLESEYASEMELQEPSETHRTTHLMNILARALEANKKRHPDPNSPPLPQDVIQRMIEGIGDQKAIGQYRQRSSDPRAFVTSLAGQLHEAWRWELWRRYPTLERREEFAKTQGPEQYEAFQKTVNVDPHRAYHELFEPVFKADSQELSAALDLYGLKFPPRQSPRGGPGTFSKGGDNRPGGNRSRGQENGGRGDRPPQRGDRDKPDDKERR